MMKIQYKIWIQPDPFFQTIHNNQEILNVFHLPILKKIK